jgi:hypothetical protein
VGFVVSGLLVAGRGAETGVDEVGLIDLVLEEFVAEVRPGACAVAERSVHD